MLTASQKKRENIAEYLLYMWQIEDLIRAHGLDMDKIKTGIIDRYQGLNVDQVREMTQWYESLIDMMRREDVKERGHLQINKNVIIELTDLCKRILADPKYSAFEAEYYRVLPDIVELRAKAGNDKKDEIETCFEALYGILLLKLQHKEISAPTAAAAERISKFLAMLALYYRQEQNGELKFSDD